MKAEIPTTNVISSKNPLCMYVSGIVHHQHVDAIFRRIFSAWTQSRLCGGGDVEVQDRSACRFLRYVGGELEVCLATGGYDTVASGEDAMDEGFTGSGGAAGYEPG